MKMIEIVLYVVLTLLGVCLIGGVVYSNNYELQLDLDDETPTPTPKPTQTEEVIREIKAELTYYCCEDMGSKSGTTASGVKLTDGQEPERNIVACNWLPFGSKLDINGKIYYVEDRGGHELSRFGRLDIYEHRGVEQCKINGRHPAVVKLLRKGK
jgi:3D (Asp-Asp-Asp) domain-containing protein